ncbi:MAG: ATP-grasp domain-containing protein [bacterium]
MTKNIILYVGTPPKENDAIRAYEKQSNRSFRVALLYDNKKSKRQNIKPQNFDICIPCNFNSIRSITKALIPYQDDLMVITGIGEKSMPYLQKVIPYVPYLRTPTSESLGWSTSKILMREHLQAYDTTLTPEFMVVRDITDKTIADIKNVVGFPLVIKPTGLAESLLVSICYHEEELEHILKKTFKKIKAVYKAVSGRGEPTVLVEQFMEGKMYSIDGYVNSRGATFFCPMVYVKTGRSIGFDDFFGYQQMTPTILTKESIDAAQGISKKAIKALCLRSTTVHIELMKTSNGWKVIELGPRKGGFRHQMYSLSYNINHTMNDILIRIPEKPIIPKKIKGYTAAMKFFAKKEGKLIKLTGLKKAEELKSFYSLKISKKLGEQCRYAKHGGRSVFNIILFNPDRSKLLADIHRLEQMIKIETD